MLVITGTTCLVVKQFIDSQEHVHVSNFGIVRYWRKNGLMEEQEISKPFCELDINELGDMLKHLETRNAA